MEIPSDDVEAEQARSDLHRDYFLGWQCRIREHISRKENGRPSKGISPTVQLRADDKVIATPTTHEAFYELNFRMK